MLQVGDVILSLDVIEKEFCCDIGTCKGICCQEGDAGAPLEAEEIELIKELLPTVWDELTPAARMQIEAKGVCYQDPEGDWVTQVVDGRDCVFAVTDHNGVCQCVFDRAYHQGRIAWQKPISCHLYPIRVKNFGSFVGLNYHRWDICHCARQLGKKQKIKVYQFLREPLVRRFGEQWYRELEATVAEWEKAKHAGQKGW